MNFVCRNCRNSVPAGARECPYCLAPQQTGGKNTRPALVAAAGVLVLAAAAIVTLRTTTATLDPASEPRPAAAEHVLPEPTPTGSLTSGPAEFEAPQYREEKTLMDVYNNLLLASAHKDEARIRSSLSKGAFAEIEKNRYDMMDFATSDITFDNMKTIVEEEKGDRALLAFTGSSDIITDEKGNPASAYGIYQFEREEGRWKLLSLVWHIHPPDDPVAEARKWLDGGH